MIFKFTLDPETTGGLQFTEGGLQISAEPRVSLRRESSGNQIVALATGLAVYLSSAVAPSATAGKTEVDVNLNSLALTSIFFAIGNFEMNLSLLKYPLNLLIWVIVKIVNEFFLNSSYEIDTPSASGFTLNALDTHFHQGYVTLAVDASYTPT